MAGYVARTGTTSGVLDPLELHAIVAEDGNAGRWSLVVVDLACASVALTAAVRERSGDQAVWVAGTHTHAGPVCGCASTGGETPRYLLDQVAALAAEALSDADLGMVRLHQFTLDIAGVGSTRAAAAPTGPVPCDVVVALDGAELAGLLVVLPVHPTVLPAANTALSADLPGGVRRALTARLGGGPWIVVATGAAGDISTRHHRRAADAAEIDRLGELVADQIRSALPTAGPTSDGRVRSSRALWNSPTTGLDPAQTGSALAAAKTAIAAYGVQSDPARRTLETALQGAQARHQRALAGGWPEEIGVEIAAATVDGVAFASLPGEPYLALRDRVRRSVPGAVVLGYTNGYPGYLPDEAAYDHPTYEVLMSPFPAGTGERVADTAIELLRGER